MLAALAVPHSASAGIADPDPTFGGDGTVVYDSDVRVRDVVVDSNGKTIVLGRRFYSPTAGIELTRFEDDGDLDPTFGTGGNATAYLNSTTEAPSQAVGNAVTIDASGRFVVAGYARIGGVARAVIVRFTSTGDLDTSFDGDGVWYAPAGNDHKLFDVLVAGDGTIVAAGSAGDQGTTKSGFYGVRLDPATSTVTGTYEDLVASADPHLEDGARAVDVAPGGGYYLAGTLTDSLGDPAIAVAHMNADGSRDASFGPSGDGYGVSAIPDDSHGRAAVVEGGKVYVAGNTDVATNELAIARFNLDGSPDTTFATDSGGAASDHRTFDLGRSARFGALQPAGDGKLWAVAGVMGDGASVKNQALLLRLMPDGTPDASFAANGVGSVVDQGWPYVDGEADSFGSNLQDVHLALSGAKPVIASSAEDATTPTPLPQVGIVRYGKADVVPPDPGTGGGAGGGDGSSSGGSGGGAVPPGGGGGASPTPAPQPTPVLLTDTTRAATMPDVRGLEVQKAIGSLDKRFFADVTVKYTNEPTDQAKDIGQVAAQNPAPKAKISSAAGESRNVVLTVYEGPKPVGKHKCPEAELVKELKGLGPLYAEQVAKQLKCRIEVEVEPKPAAKVPAIFKITAKDDKVTLKVNQPTKPERNGLFLSFTGRQFASGSATFNADDWSVPVDVLDQFAVTVFTRSGDLVKNAQITVDASDVGTRDLSRPSGADGPGTALFGIRPAKTGKVTVRAQAEVGGQVVTGVGEFYVKKLDTFTTVTGNRVKVSGDRAVPAKETVRSAGLLELWNSFLGALFGTTQQQVNQAGRSPQQNLASAATQRKAFPAQVALGKPLGGASGNARITNGDVLVVSGGKVGTARAPLADAKGGNVILASTTGGLTSASNTSISREIDLKRAKILSDNGLGLISDNGLGLISDNGLGIISDNGLGIISDNGLGLITRDDRISLSSVSGITSTYGGGILSTYGGR